MIPVCGKKTRVSRNLGAHHSAWLSRQNNAFAAFVRVFALSTALLLVFGTCGAAQNEQAVGKAEGKRYVTDMAGRRVALPGQVKRIVTLGPVPVLNSFIFTLGEGEKIVNGLPLSFARSPRYRYQTLFAPSLAHEPDVQGNAGGRPDLEALLKARPDVIFTMDLQTTDVLERNGFAAVFLSWRQPEDVKGLMRLVGEVLNRQDGAAEYIRYFDDTVKRVGEVVSRVPQGKRPRVLLCTVRTLTQPHLIAEWWIETAGGTSVTNNGRSMESFTFSLEQMLAWNPDILLVSGPEDLKEVYEDRRFLAIKAVKSRRIYVAPCAAHLWANRTAEQPLTVLWAAKIFHPELFKNLDLIKEMQYFYGRFFHYRMSDGEAREILNGAL
jgi:iron complex transport system substrate-binding protein